MFLFQFLNVEIDSYVLFDIIAEREEIKNKYFPPGPFDLGQKFSKFLVGILAEKNEFILSLNVLYFPEFSTI